jgi:N-acetylglucosamine kinase-like BadF-type ATPase
VAEQYLLALEGGGTRSQAALMDLAGQVLQVFEAGEVNTNFIPFAQAQQAVLHAVEIVLQSAGVPGEQVLYFASSLVGPDFGAETFGSLCPRAVFRHYSECDVVFARARVYQPHGVALVAATGATAFGVRAGQERREPLGGWGSLLGDEGSAYHLGLLGLRSAVLAFERRAPAETRLVEAVCDHFDLHRAQFREELVRLAYGKPLSRADIAGFAARVTRLASAGDPLASHITAQVVADLAALMLHAARRTFHPGDAFDVVVAGGMVNAGELVLGPLREKLSAEFPKAVLKVGHELPAVALGRLELYNSQGVNWKRPS